MSWLVSCRNLAEKRLPSQTCYRGIARERRGIDKVAQGRMGITKLASFQIFMPLPFLPQKISPLAFHNGHHSPTREKDLP
jgi:hypothetical protein